MSKRSNKIRRPLYHDERHKLHTEHRDIDELYEIPSLIAIIVLAMFFYLALIAIGLLIEICVTKEAGSLPTVFHALSISFACSAAVFVAYLLNATPHLFTKEIKEESYFIGDFPFENVRCIAVFICMIWFWPLIFYSAYRLLYKDEVQPEILGESQKVSARNEELQNNEAQKDEEDEIECIDTTELDYSYFTKDPIKHANPDDIRIALAASLKMSQTYLKSTMEENIYNVEQELDTLSKQIRQKQSELNELRSKLAVFKQSSATLDHEQLVFFANNIAKMRGVMKVEYIEKRQFLRVIVRVLVPYEDEVYDFGDYHIIIHKDDLTAYTDRYGTIADLTLYSDGSTEKDFCGPLYSISDQFCFGENESIIDDYINSGQYAEAIALAIEALHHVNENDLPDIPRTYRKAYQVSPSEAKKLAAENGGVIINV